MRKFRLLKELPDFKKGIIFVLTRNSNYGITERNYRYEINNSSCFYDDDPTYHMDYLNNPVWFEEIKEDSEKKSQVLIQDKKTKEIRLVDTMANQIIRLEKNEMFIGTI